MNKWVDLKEEICNHLQHDNKYAWVVSPGAREKLSNFLSLNSIDYVFEAKDANKINRRIRKVLSPILRGQDRARAAEVALWIVSSWGGIRRGTNSVGDWSNKLSDYSNEKIVEFISDFGVRRISSWSKLLAFAWPERHAIYDARTAVALNCILHQIGVEERFYMPPSRNKQINSATTILSRQSVKLDKTLGYWEYLDLLNAISNFENNHDILHVEMIIFANAPRIAEEFSQSIVE